MAGIGANSFLNYQAPAPTGNIGLLLGQGIQRSREERQQKEQQKAFAAMAVKNPFFQQMLPPGTKPEELVKVMSKLDPTQQESVIGMFVQAEKLDQGLKQLDINQQNADANTTQADAYSQGVEARNKPTVDPNKFTKEEIGKLREIPGLKGKGFIPTSSGGGQLVDLETGESEGNLVPGSVIDIDGERKLWTGQTWVDLRDPNERFKEAFNTWQNKAFQDWYYLYYNDDGSRRDVGKLEEEKGWAKFWPGDSRASQEAKNKEFEAIEKYLKNELQDVIAGKSAPTARPPRITIYNPGGTAPTKPMVEMLAPQSAIDYLRKNPGSKDQFIAKYGKDALPNDMQ